MKVRRIDKRCPCGGEAQWVGYITSGKERQGYVCSACSTFYTKKDAKNFEQIPVLQ